MSTPPGRTSLPLASSSRSPAHRAADLDDAAAADADSAAAVGVRRDDRAAADHQLVLGAAHQFGPRQRRGAAIEVVSAKWQATRWSEGSRNGGVSSAHSLGRASSASGTGSPTGVQGARRLAAQHDPFAARRSGLGIADSSAWVYGIRGSAYSSSEGELDELSEECITPTRSLTYSTTPRSWAMNRVS